MNKSRDTEYVVDGPTLRALRQSKGIPLRKVARVGKLSHGHLSKLETGEVGRPVTPAVLVAYSKATGVDLRQDQTGEGLGGWRAGQLPPAARKKWRGTVAATSVGAPLDETPMKVIDSWGALPRWVMDSDESAQLTRVAELLWDLGGPLPGVMARQLLRWLVDLTDDPSPELQVVVSRLAHRAGLAGVELGAHNAARWLYLLALHAAVAAERPDLRAALLADIAEQCLVLDHCQDSRIVAQLAAADERIDDELRKRLYELKTRAADAVERAEAAPPGGPTQP